MHFSDESFEISLGYSYLKYQMGNECFIQSLKHYRHSNEAKSIAIFFDYVTTQNNISCVFDYILDKVFWAKKVNFVLEIAQQRCSDSKMIQLWRNMRAIESL